MFLNFSCMWFASLTSDGRSLQGRFPRTQGEIFYKSSIMLMASITCGAGRAMFQAPETRTRFCGQGIGLSDPSTFSPLCWGLF